MNTRRDRPRGFALTVEPHPSGSYGLRLDEVPHDGQRSHRVAHLSPARAARVIEDVLTVVQASGHQRSSLSSQTSQAVRLEEAPGVRLALTMLATSALQKQSRVDEVVAAISRLGDEEAYYWYGKCIGESGPRARRAFRLLLSRD